jgi:hypothetical protein
MLLFFSASVVLALDPAKAPGGNFDLSHWKLDLPDANASELLPSQLMAGYANFPYFYTAADGAMAFWCPVNGGTTSGSSFPRSELRELLDPSNDNVNWKGFGLNSLNAQCKVGQVPSTGKTVIGQIHSFTGNAYPLIKLQFNNGIVEALVKESPNSDTDSHFTFGNIGLGKLITYEIKLTDGLLSMTVNGTNQSVNVFKTDPAWTNQTLYYKAGDYCQDNSGTSSEGAAVAFYYLNVVHSSTGSGRPVISRGFIDASGHFGFNLFGQTGSNYVIQISGDMRRWNNLLTNRAGTAGFTFTETNRLGAARFYRAKLLLDTSGTSPAPVLGGFKSNQL